MHLVLNVIMHSLIKNNIKTMCLILCKAASRHQNSSEPSAMQFWGVMWSDELFESINFLWGV